MTAFSLGSRLRRHRREARAYWQQKARVAAGKTTFELPYPQTRVRRLRFWFLPAVMTTLAISDGPGVLVFAAGVVGLEQLLAAAREDALTVFADHVRMTPWYPAPARRIPYREITRVGDLVGDGIVEIHVRGVERPFRGSLQHARDGLQGEVVAWMRQRVMEDVFA